MHIVFLYSEGRLRRLESVRSGRSASEFFYGSEQLLRAGYCVSLIELRKDSAGGFRRQLLDLASSMGWLPNKTHGWLVLGARQVLHELNQHDVVIATTTGLAFSVALWKAWGLVKPEIVGIHCGILNVQPNRCQRIQVRFLLRRMWSVVLGEAELEPIKRMFGVGDDRIKVNPFGVDTDFWTPDDSVADEGYLLSVGNDPRRDYELLRRVAARLRRRVIVISRRRIHGALPPNFEQRSGSWHEEILTDEELRDMYRKAALVVIPLKDTLQPSGQSACLQAMACGKAVVLTSTRGLWSRTLITDGENIALVPPGDEEALKNRIEALLHDPDRGRSLGRRARATVVAHFAIQSFAQGMLGMCRTAVEHRRQE